jgi:hypothetical protein
VDFLFLIPHFYFQILVFKYFKVLVLTIQEDSVILKDLQSLMDHEIAMVVVIYKQRQQREELSQEELIVRKNWDDNVENEE